jgi:hypothetical protein
MEANMIWNVLPILSQLRHPPAHQGNDSVCGLFTFMICRKAQMNALLILHIFT